MNINVFDFDGVLADPIEDCVFRLDENPLDAKFIQDGRDRYGTTKLSNHIKRNRHLILQEVLYERRIPCEAGPIASRCVRGEPFYVLTARSGPGAVARVSTFLESRSLRPEEMFFVGPMSKAHCLIDLCSKFPDDQLVFWDDNDHHIQEATELGFPNLEVKFVDNGVPKLMDKALSFYMEQANWLGRNQL